MHESSVDLLKCELVSFVLGFLAHIMQCTYLHAYLFYQQSRSLWSTLFCSLIMQFLFSTIIGKQWVVIVIVIDTESMTVEILDSFRNHRRSGLSGLVNRLVCIIQCSNTLQQHLSFLHMKCSNSLYFFSRSVGCKRSWIQATIDHQIQLPIPFALMMCLIRMRKTSSSTKILSGFGSFSHINAKDPQFDLTPPCVWSALIVVFLL